MPRGATARVLWGAAVVVVAILALRRVDAAQLRAGLADAQPAWLLLAFAAHVAIQPLAARQWQCLLVRRDEADVPYTGVLRAFSVGSVANNTLNSVLGHAAGAAAVARLPHVGAARALSMLVLDQLCVGTAKVIVLALAVRVVAPMEWLRQGLIGLVAVVVLLGGVLLLVRAVRVPARWPRVLRMREALTSVSPASLVTAVLCALAVKGAEALGVAAVQHAFGLTVSVNTVLPVLAATALGTLIPVVPANVGPYEGAVFAALRVIGVPAERALVIAVVQHAVQLAAAVLPGVVLLREGMRAAQRP